MTVYIDGNSNPQPEIIKEVTTTDDTPTTVISLSYCNETLSTVIEIDVVSIDSGGLHVYSTNTKYCVQKIASDLTIVSFTILYEEHTNLNTSDVSVTIDSESVNIIVTGAEALTVKWRVRVKQFMVVQ